MKSIGVVTAFFLLTLVVRSCQPPAASPGTVFALPFVGLYEVVVVVITIGVVAGTCWWIGDGEDEE